MIHNLAYSLNVVTTTENSPFSLCLIATAVVMYSPAVRTETFNWQSPRVFGYGPSVISPCSKQQIICFIEIQRSFILSFACAVNLILLVSLANALSFCLASVNVKHIQANTKVLGKSKRMLNRQILTVSDYSSFDNHAQHLKGNFLSIQIKYFVHRLRYFESRLRATANV
ncbi:hypothetical protein ACIN3137_A0005 [Acinetobacter baumannii OIFC137]|nr:hypothetical protein ACIN3137_A0005 [Acinetobacter baumannii OIFC137]